MGICPLCLTCTFFEKTRSIVEGCWTNFTHPLYWRYTESRCDTAMRKFFIILFIILAAAVGILYYLKNDKSQLDQPLITQEQDEELIEEYMEEVAEETVAEEEADSFAGRFTIAIQETFDRIFQRELKIVAIGDSLTRGIGDETNSGGYVGILERSLNQERKVASFENLGVPGNRSDHLLNRLGYQEVQEKIADADIVLITIGANDIMQVAKENILNLAIDDFIEERDEYEIRLEQILDAMREFNGDAEIYLLGIYNPFEKYFQEIEELNQIVEAWNETGMELIGERENMTFIPIIDLFSGNLDPIFADDNFHPNYEGYYLMAERVLEYISGEEG